MEIDVLLRQRRELIRKKLYANGEEYAAIKVQVEELDKIIPWVQYRITGANTEQRRDGGSWEFQSIRTDLDVKPLTMWTDEELEQIPWHIEDPDIAVIEKI